MDNTAIPVTLVTGFLGAGKSTLVQHWLAELPREQTAVIVNERGEIGIDGELLSANIAGQMTRLREITGGCACCSSQAELVSALNEFSSVSPKPQRILVETSGAASPAGVIRALQAPRLRDRLQLDGVITVADATRLPTTLKFDLAVEQLAFADVVVLSHVDRLESSDADLSSADTTVAQHAPAAVITHARRGTSTTPLLELLAQRGETLHEHTAGSSHAVIEAISLTLDGEMNEERFGIWVEQALGAVGARILRLKGIVALAGLDARVIVQGVGEDVDVQLGRPWSEAPRTSRLVVLGLGLDAAALEAGFKLCAAASGGSGGSA